MKDKELKVFAEAGYTFKPQINKNYSPKPLEIK